VAETLAVKALLSQLSVIKDDEAVLLGTILLISRLARKSIFPPLKLGYLPRRDIGSNCLGGIHANHACGV
jgi:hypothetical protein